MLLGPCSVAAKRHRKGKCNGSIDQSEGKVALVTGASSGLGQRFAQVLSQAGARSCWRAAASSA
jgi:NADPH:quinone reductase-like Zn-dependent oxidoreductase